MRKWRLAGGLVVGFALGTTLRCGASETNGTDKAKAGIERVTSAGKYALAVFRRGEEGVASVREVVKEAVGEAKGRAEAVDVDVADAGVAQTVRGYGVNRAPLPLVLVIAPNGAVTGGAPSPAEPEVLTDCLIGPKGAACMKALQDGKVVVICVQGNGNKNAEATQKTVAAFKVDQRIAGFAESVVIDPGDQAEQSFLGRLRVDSKRGADTTLLSEGLT